jgi:exopolyphosphatase/guanosine-5'-triphosphate,3'-diphosphate pyrophosphatase
MLQPIHAGAAATLVAVGGTAANMGAVQKSHCAGPGAAHGSRLTDCDIQRQIEMYSSVRLDRRREIPGLDPSRADVILGGALILREAMAALDAPEIFVSCRGLRWGLLSLEAERLKTEE